MGIASSGTSVIALVTGVFAGSALRWLMLSGLAGLLCHRMSLSTNAMAWINRISGVVIVAFGLIALFGAHFGA